jgi:hypothetical protein
VVGAHGFDCARDFDELDTIEPEQRQVQPLIDE